MARPTRERFESSVREHHAAVFRSALRVIGRAADAADVAQDVFVRVFEGKVRLDVADSERATLCWLASRLAANALRAGRRRRDHEETAMSAPFRSIPSTLDPATACADRDLQRAVGELVGQLPHELQVPLQMRCQDDLTFAAIGTALRVPESTVHDRVQDALQRLRKALVERGFVITAGGVPALVAASDVVVGAPADLQARLLALPERFAGAATSFTINSALAIGAVVMVVGIAAVAGTWSGGWTPPAVGGLPAVVADRGLQSPIPSPALPSDAGTERTLATEFARSEAPAADAPAAIVGSSPFHGTVHDAAAWPVAGATVRAVAAGGYKAFELGATTTDALGAFRLDVDPGDFQPTRIRLWVVESGNVLLETDELALPRGNDAAALALVLPPSAGVETDRFEMRVTVVGEDGAPLAAVPVALSAAAADVPVARAHNEATAVSDAAGVAVLHGRRLGAKNLFVDGSELGRRSHRSSIAIDRGGRHEATVTMRTGRTLEIRVGTVDGEAIEWSSVWAEDEITGQQLRAELAADGATTLRGLGDGAYTLHVSGASGLSPFERAGVRAADGPVVVRLKRQLDPRDVGDHMAELHGELVDAATGAVVPFTAFQVDVLPVRAGESTFAFDRVVPRGPVQQLEGSGEQRSFVEVGLRAGRWGVVVDVPGYAPAVAEFDLRTGEMRTGIRVPLHRGIDVRGRVVTNDGQSVRRAMVFAIGVGALADEGLARWRTLDDQQRDREPDPTYAVRQTRTAADGTFVLRGLPADVALRVVARQAATGLEVAPLPQRASGGTVDGLELCLRAP